MGKRGRPISRPSAQSPGPKKKTKHDPLLEGVLEGISTAELPTACKDMLLAVAPHCLLTYRSERHESQEAVVSWIEKVLADVRDSMQEASVASSKEGASAEARLEELQQAVVEAKAAAAAAEEAIAGCEKKLAEAKQASVAAGSHLNEMQEKEFAGNKELVQAEKEKKQLEKLLDESFGYLRRDEGFEVEKAKTCINELWTAAQAVGLDESLVVAVPPAAEKQPSSRGGFDNQVLDQLENSLRARVEKYEATLADAAPAREERAKAVSEASSARTTAEEALRGATSALAAAGEARQQAKAKVVATESAVKEFSSVQGEALAAMTEKKAALENFIAYNMECFNQLRDRQPLVLPRSEEQGLGGAEVAEASAEAAGTEEPAEGE